MSKIANLIIALFILFVFCCPVRGEYKISSPSEKIEIEIIGDKFFS